MIAAPPTLPLPPWPAPSPPAAVAAGPGRGARALSWVLAVAVALAFADASVVVLGLPAIYAEFDTTIVGVSWVITAYAVAVAAVGLVLIPLHRRLRPLAVTVVGVALFAAASLAAALAPATGALLAARVVQGAGAALLLAGSLPVLAALRGAPATARTVWTAAGTVGAAFGPALGGLLTQLLDWRAIFFLQAPVAAAALTVALSPTARQARPVQGPRVRSGAGAGNFAFLLLFAASVGALFLAVLLVVEVWRYEPLAGAAVVSTLPLAALAVRPLTHRLAAVARLAGGVVALTAGLVALALLPAVAAGWLAAALAACGAGFGLVVDALDPHVLGRDGRLLRAALLTSTARHAGLVLGLALVAPILAGSLERGADDAALRGVTTMLDARLPLSDKIPLAWDLRNAIVEAPAGQRPDLDAVFAARGADDDAGLQRVQDDLATSVGGALTRGFRSSFLIAAGLGVLVIIPGLIAVARRSPGARAPTTRAPALALVAPTTRAPALALVAPTTLAPALALVVIAVASTALVAGELAAGARAFGVYRPADPCTSDPTPYPGDGVDPALQRIGLGAINGAACELHTTRERLVLSFDPEGGMSDVTWDKETAEDALRAGAHRAIDDGADRGSLPRWAAIALGFVVDKAPVDWLLDRTPLPG